MKMPTLEEMIKVIDACPLGYAFGQVVMPRNLSEADLMAWLEKLYAIKDRLRASEAFDVTHGGRCPTCGGEWIKTAIEVPS